MNSFFIELMQVRKQLVSQQSSINECLATIDRLISSQLNNIPNNDEKNPDIPNYSKLPKFFPKDNTTKRDKLRHILSETNEPMTAREIKTALLQYGETLPNVDQSLVNLEKDGLIKSKNDGGRKKYYLPK